MIVGRYYSLYISCLLGTVTLCLKVNFYSVAQVTISQMNGQDYQSHSSHTFHVGKARIKLCRGWITKARDIYSASMQVHVWKC